MHNWKSVSIPGTVQGPLISAAMSSSTLYFNTLLTMTIRTFVLRTVCDEQTNSTHDMRSDIRLSGQT